jgi:release factor glutamine methyltransferase
MLERMEVSDADLRALIDEKYDGSTENKSALRHDMNRLALGEPLAYVIGWIPFLGTRIYLDSKPLIPRPETEWWTEELIKTLTLRQTQATHIKLLDLCAGSGAIGCAILKHCPNLEVSFGEFDPAHESTIRKNVGYAVSHIGRSVPYVPDVHIGDLFEPFRDEKFDVIAANPPYIPVERELDASVTQYEPSQALFAGDHGLALIRRIAAEAPHHLHPGGELWMECDISNIEEARNLVIAGGAKEVDIRTDPYGRKRLIMGHY